jgi:predicted hotdog family 3-hydroxylacyl-ACP dehydratase
LASVRDVRFAAAALDAAAGEVAVDAELLAGDAGGASYRFALTRNGLVLLSGRATVILETTA